MRAGCLPAVILSLILFSADGMCSPPAFANSWQDPAIISTGPPGTSLQIRGRVLDFKQRKPLQGAQVTLSNRLGVVLARSSTNAEGFFWFQNLGKSLYRVNINQQGYQPLEQQYDLQNQTAGSGFSSEIFLLQPMPPEKEKDPSISDPIVSVEELQIPPDARSAFERGVKELHEKKNPKKSVAHFRRAIEIHSSYAEALIQLGLAYIQLQDYTHARATLENATALAKDVRTFMLLSLVYKGLGEVEEQRESLQKALELDPSNYAARAELARTCLQIGLVALAEEHARKAQELGKEDPNIYLLLFNIASKKNDLGMAEATLVEFLQLFPDHPSAPEVRQKLQQLRQIRGT